MLVGKMRMPLWRCTALMLSVGCLDHKLRNGTTEEALGNAFIKRSTKSHGNRLNASWTNQLRGLCTSTIAFERSNRLVKHHADQPSSRTLVFTTLLVGKETKA